MAHLENIIIADEPMGKGTESSPCRRVAAFYKTDGTPLGDIDPCAPYEDLLTGEWVFDREVKIRIEEKKQSNKAI